MSKVIYEGWMLRCGRRKIGRSFIHMRYFVLESQLLAYYKKKPQDNVVPIKTLHIDGNCRLEDKGLKTHHGHVVYVLSVYNKKEMCQQITMAAFNLQEVLTWKEKIAFAIDQHSLVSNGGGAYSSFEYKSAVDDGKSASSSDNESQYSALEDEGQNHPVLRKRTTIGNGPPESVPDWTRDFGLGLPSLNNGDKVFSRKHWRLVRCQNGLRIFEELLEVDRLPRRCSKAMKAVGVVEASCEAIFELVMGMDGTRFEFVWPRDFCYVRYWRRNDDGSYVVLFHSREHANCAPQPGFVRAHIESGGFKISPLKPRNRRSRTQVQHLMQVDLKGWAVGHIPSFQQHCLLQLLNNVAGLRDWFNQTDGSPVVPRISAMVKMNSDSVPSKRDLKPQGLSFQRGPALDQINTLKMMDEYTEDEEEFQTAEPQQEASMVRPESDVKQAVMDEETSEQIDLSCFSGNLRRDDSDNSRDCWSISDGKNFKVRSKQFLSNKSKIPAGKHLMELVAVDWFKDAKRMDHVARCPGCAVQVASEKGLFSLAINLQVPGSTHYSLVFYFVTKRLLPGSLLQRFIDGDDEFRNSRLKLIPSVPKGSWIVRQSVGSSACLLGKAVDCNYIRGPKYLEIDIDIGSSTVANGVLGLVCGVITTLVVDMAFLVQANTYDELPEQLIGAVRGSHIELSSAIIPNLEARPSCKSTDEPCKSS